jgi:hypothetical protein
LIAAMTSFVLSLGAAELRSDALASLSWLPWQSLVKWPLLDDVLPGRFALLTDLALSVLVAIGLDATRKRFTGSSRSSDEPMVLPDPDVQGGVTPWRRPVGLAGVMCVVAASSLVPIWRLYSIPTATEEVHVPPWFSTAALRLPTGSVVLTYPFPASASLSSEAMIWQAVDNMQFGLAGGYVKVPGPDGHPLAAGTPGSATSSLTLLTLVKQTPENAWSPSPAELAAIRSALSSWKVAFIVVTATGSNPVYTAAVMTAVSGRVPQVSHRAWVWNLHAAALATPFNAVAASSAFGACRLKPNMYQTLPASDPIPQGANMCVLDALDSRADP